MRKDSVPTTEAPPPPEARFQWETHPTQPNTMSPAFAWDDPFARNPCQHLSEVGNRCLVFYYFGFWVVFVAGSVLFCRIHQTQPSVRFCHCYWGLLFFHPIFFQETPPFFRFMPPFLELFHLISSRNALGRPSAAGTSVWISVQRTFTRSREALIGWREVGCWKMCGVDCHGEPSDNTLLLSSNNNNPWEEEQVKKRWLPKMSKNNWWKRNNLQKTKEKTFNKSQEKSQKHKAFNPDQLNEGQALAIALEQKRKEDAGSSGWVLARNWGAKDWTK